MGGHDSRRAPTVGVRHLPTSARVVIAHATPAAALRPDVCAYEGFVEVHSSPVARSVVPAPRVKLNISFGSPIRIAIGPGGSYTTFRRGFVAGIHDRAVDCEHEGFRHRLNVTFTAPGAFRFFGVPASALQPYMDSDDVLGPFANVLRERLGDLATWEERFALLDRLISERMANASPTTVNPIGERALRRIDELGGDINVKTLAAELGYSRKHVFASVRTLTGMSPSLFARLVRFDRAVRALRQVGLHPWAEVAQSFGYYDQSHFCRELRRFAGVTPTELHTELAGAAARGVPGRIIAPT